MARKKIIAGNWKMNMTPSEAVALVNELKPLVVNDEVDVVFCVPAIDIIPAMEAAKETNTLLEVNNNSLNPMGARKHTRENLIAMLELCKEYKQPVVMNSDSHVFCDVARRDFSEKLIEEINFPEELIVNRSVDVFKEYIHRKYKEDK